MITHRSYLAALAFTPLIAIAQIPPLDIEWVALRSFGHGSAYIAHDNTSDSYIWAVYDDVNLPDDELIYPITADGTDLGPTFPGAFNVGSLDHLVDLEMMDSVTYALMAHQDIGGSPQVHLWHILGPSVDVTIGALDHDEFGNDVLVDATGVYACGKSQLTIETNLYTGRLLHTDLQGNEQWNITWNDDDTPTEATFSSVAVMGDSVLVADFPNLVIFDRTDGSFIGTFTPFGSTPIHGDARIAVNGTRVFWAMGSSDSLYYGNYDFGNLNGLLGAEQIGTDVSLAGLVVTETGENWIGFNTAGQGKLMRTDVESTVLSISTVYEGITDMDWKNGSLSITGSFDQATPVTYVISGTPQP